MDFSNLDGTAQKSAPNYVWFGLDFGTATTECVVRIETQGRTDRVLVLAVRGKGRGDAEVVIPSCVEHEDGEVRGGCDLRGRGELREGIKLGLLEEVRSGLQRDALRRPGGPFMDVLIHVSAVLRVAFRAVSEMLPDGAEGYYLNLAAPLGPNPASDGKAENDRLREVMLSIGAMALRLACEPASLDRTGRAQRLAEAFTLTEEDRQGVTVTPEALASVAAFLHAPNLRPGNFATIDIGGGSTDVSFFWFDNGQYSRAGDRKAWYYAIRTEPIGMENLLAHAAEKIAEISGRTRHEGLASAPTLLDVVDQRRVAEFIDSVGEVYRQTFGQSFDRMPDFTKWQTGGESNWDLLLVGGGCGDRAISNRLHGKVPHQQIREHRETERLGVPVDLPVLLPLGKRLKFGGKSPEDCVQRHSHILTVAYGLSFRSPDIPRYDRHEKVVRKKTGEAWTPPRDSLYGSSD